MELILKVISNAMATHSSGDIREKNKKPQWTKSSRNANGKEKTRKKQKNSSIEKENKH